MILLCGIPSEPTFAMVCEQVEKQGAPAIIFNQRRFEDIDIEFEIKSGQIRGILRIAGLNHRLEDFYGVYTRLMDPRHLPEVEDEAPQSMLLQRCFAVHYTLMQWYNIAPVRVVSRTGPMGSNFSKPYQSQLIQKQGFLVPETLVTNDPALVHEFRERHAKLIYKSISSVRSIVQTFGEGDIQRLDHIRWCPVQFQRYIEGTDVRVHVVDDEVFATAVKSRSTDYRYAPQESDQAELRAFTLDDELERRCIGLSKSLGLTVSGIDLKITPENEVYCFEVNPSPAFSYYESQTDQPIAGAIARYLIGEE